MQNNPHPKITNSAWFKNPSVQKLISVLNKEGEARFVGGCVRNSLLDEKSSDVDIATTVLPDDVMDLLERNGITAIPTGLKHGTVTAVLAGGSYEITTLRKDIATDGRHAEVVFTDQWMEDASRRDFTINALYADQNGVVYDFFDGLDALKTRKIQFIGDARQRITEDVLRIMRYFRFHAEYSADDFDQEGMKACADLAHLIPNLSGERIRNELMKTLLGTHQVTALKKMSDCGALDYILPSVKPDQLYQDYCEYEESYLMPDPLARMAVLFGFDGRMVESVDPLKLSNREKRHIVQLLNAYQEVRAGTQELSILYKYGKDVFLKSYLKNCLAHNQIDLFKKAHQDYHHWERPVFPLGGKDLLDIGIEAGEQMGAILSQTEEWWLSQNAEPDFEACIKHAKSLDLEN